MHDGVSSSGNATVAARTESNEGTHVGGVSSSKNVKKVSHDSSSSRTHISVAPATVAFGSTGGDQYSSAGFQVRASTGGYDRSLEPPNERHAGLLGLRVSSVASSRCNDFLFIEDKGPRLKYSRRCNNTCYDASICQKPSYHSALVEDDLVATKKRECGSSIGNAKAGRGTTSKSISESTSRVDRYTLCDKASQTVPSAMFVDVDDRIAPVGNCVEFLILGVASPGTGTQKQRNIRTTRGLVCAITIHETVWFFQLLLRMSFSPFADKGNST